jgi:hypothetical protein
LKHTKGDGESDLDAETIHLEKSRTLSNLSDAEIVATGLTGRRLDASKQGTTTGLMRMQNG